MPAPLWASALRIHAFRVLIEPQFPCGFVNGSAMLKSTILAAALLASSFAAAAQTPLPAPDPLEVHAEEIRDRFVAAVRNCGVEPTFVPAVFIRTSPALATYHSGDRALYLSRYEELPPPIQQTMQAWAANGTLGLDAAGQFGEIFNTLVVPHELGHALQFMWGRHPTLDRWESETEANRIAIAFWALDPAEAERLPQRIENVTGFLSRLPNPVPEGRSPREHFNADYWALLADPQAYGWFQGTLMQTAWEDRGQNDFCTLVRLNAAGAPA